MSDSETQTQTDPQTETEAQTDEDTETEPETQPQEQEREQPSESPDLTTERGGFRCVAEQQALLDFFETFDPLLDELRLHIDPDGFSALGVDPANVAFVRDRLDADAFEHYSSTGGLLGLNLARIIDVLSLADSKDTLVAFELDQETRKLEIEIGSMEFTIALIDPDSIRQEPEIPDLDLPVTATFEGRHLSRGVTAAEMASDHVRFRTGETDDGTDALLLEATGDTDDVELALRDADGGELIDFDTEGPANSLFSLDYLKDMVKVIPDDAAITLRLGEEFPFRIEYEHNKVDDETHGEALFLLAPRIESD